MISKFGQSIYYEVVSCGSSEMWYTLIYYEWSYISDGDRIDNTISVNHVYDLDAVNYRTIVN